MSCVVINHSLPKTKEEMKHKQISEKYRRWIIEFHSERFSKPIFFIWLTDTSSKDEKDQILITKSQKIIIAKSKKKLIKRILESNVKLPDSKRTKKWLKKSLNFTKLSSTKIDLRDIERKILSNKLKSKEIEEITNFINLYEDYRIQLIKKKAKLKTRTPKLNNVWSYYYEQIFFPNFNKINQKTYTPNQLKIDNKKLFKDFSKLLEDFENNFEFIKKEVSRKQSVNGIKNKNQ